MKLGLVLPLVPGLVTSGEFMREYMATVEDLDFVESVWGVEHIVVVQGHEPRYPYSPDGVMGEAFNHLPMSSPLELLAFVAAVSTRVKLGTCVMLAPLHSPVVLAKRVATVDSLCGGRMMLGLGIGWQKEEYAAVGVPFADRGARLEEGVGAMRAIWRDTPATFHGEHVSFDRVFSHPKPERGSVPILFGGNSAPVLDRVARIGDGWLPFTIGPDEISASVDVIRRTAEVAGRDADAIEITAWPGSHDVQSEHDLDHVRRYAKAGATRILLWPDLTSPDGLPALRTQLARYGEDVLAQL